MKHNYSCLKINGQWEDFDIVRDFEEKTKKIEFEIYFIIRVHCDRLLAGEKRPVLLKRKSLSPEAPPILPTHPSVIPAGSMEKKTDLAKSEMIEVINWRIFIKNARHKIEFSITGPICFFHLGEYLLFRNQLIRAYAPLFRGFVIQIDTVGTDGNVCDTLKREL